MTIPQSTIDAYYEHLVCDNKAPAAIRESVRYANRFAQFIKERDLCEQLLDEYRKYIDEYYSTYNSKNSCVTHVNSLLRFLDKRELAIAYFESSRVDVKLKTHALTEEDITKLLYYADKHG